MSPLKIKSKRAATENIKRFFANAPELDEISLKEAFIAWGRANPENVEANKPWLSNILGHLKYHNLITPVYEFGEGPKKLSKLKLTLEGKKALGRIESASGVSGGSAVSTQNGVVSIADVMRLVKRLKKENPEYEVTFDIKLKGGV